MGDDYSGDWRPSLLAVSMLAAYIAILLIEPLYSFSELLVLPWWAQGAIIVTTLVQAILLG